MFLSENAEELSHAYTNLRSRSNNGYQTQAIRSKGMELQGRWEGMYVVAANGPTARSLGVREAERGVVIAGLVRQQDARARRSGVAIGDVIVGVDRKPIADLRGLLAASQKSNAGSSTLLDVRRRGQPMTLVLPAANTGMRVGRPSAQMCPHCGRPMWSGRR